MVESGTLTVASCDTASMTDASSNALPIPAVHVINGKVTRKVGAILSPSYDES